MTTSALLLPPRRRRLLTSLCENSSAEPAALDHPLDRWNRLKVTLGPKPNSEWCLGQGGGPGSGSRKVRCGWHQVRLDPGARRVSSWLSSAAFLDSVLHLSVPRGGLQQSQAPRLLRLLMQEGAGWPTTLYSRKRRDSSSSAQGRESLTSGSPEPTSPLTSSASTVFCDHHQISPSGQSEGLDSLA